MVHVCMMALALVLCMQQYSSTSTVCTVILIEIVILVDWNHCQGEGNNNYGHNILPTRDQVARTAPRKVSTIEDTSDLKPYQNSTRNLGAVYAAT